MSTGSPGTQQSQNVLSGKRVTVMGLGLHGGGLESARFCLSRQAQVTVTDLRSEEILKHSIDALGQSPNLTYVLGEHREEDFRNCDIILKNPAVKRDNRYLQVSRESGARIESDIGLFLQAIGTHPNSRCAHICAITGSKGKSSTSTALHHLLISSGRKAFLGGNITVSPLSFLDEILGLLDSATDTYIVLELSSFQIGDLNLAPWGARKAAEIAIITSIYRDHQDYYGNMEDYVEDKRLLLDMLAPEALTILGHCGTYRDTFAASAITTDSNSGLSEPLLAPDQNPIDIQLHNFPDTTALAGSHQKDNMRLAATAARFWNLTTNEILDALPSYRGVPHRLEEVANSNDDILFINDSAATIPEAALAGVQAFKGPVVLICGGSDKQLDLGPLVDACLSADSFTLLPGTATDRLIDLLEDRGVNVQKPVTSMAEAVGSAFTQANTVLAKTIKDEPGGTPVRILLSPGCASFGLFLNEFDRGRQFVSAVQALQ